MSERKRDEDPRIMLLELTVGLIWLLFLSSAFMSLWNSCIVEITTVAKPVTQLQAFWCVCVIYLFRIGKA